MALFLVRMTVNWPRDLKGAEAEALRAREKDYAAGLQRSGVWKHLWRTTGVFGNVSVFDVESHEHLHEVLTGLPFFPMLDIEIEPLSDHPGRVAPDP